MDDTLCTTPDCTHLAQRDGYCLPCATDALAAKILVSRLERIPPERRAP